jgi:hypothetical protein
VSDVIESVPKQNNTEDVQRLAARLVEQARAEGVDLVGPGGLLTGLTKTVLETALEFDPGVSRRAMACRTLRERDRAERQARIADREADPEAPAPGTGRPGSYLPVLARRHRPIQFRRLGGLGGVLGQVAGHHLVGDVTAAGQGDVFDLDPVPATLVAPHDRPTLGPVPVRRGGEAGVFGGVGDGVFQVQGAEPGRGRHDGLGVVGVDAVQA